VPTFTRPFSATIDRACDPGQSSRGQDIGEAIQALATFSNPMAVS